MLPSTGSESKLASGPASGLASGPASKAQEKEMAKGLEPLNTVVGEIKLTSKDNQVFVVEKKHAYISKLIQTALENDDKATEIPLPSVRGSILSLIIAYMKEHKGLEPPLIEKPLRSKLMADVCPFKTDATFIDKVGENRQVLYDLILAANFMDVSSLLHLGCAKVASLIKGQPLEKIQEILKPEDKKDKDSKDKKEKEDVKTKSDDADVKMNVPAPSVKK